MLTRKSRGTGAVLAYRGHLLTENRNGLVVSALTARAYGAADRGAAASDGIAEAVAGRSIQSQEGTEGCPTRPHGEAVVSSCGTRIGPDGTVTEPWARSPENIVRWSRPVRVNSSGGGTHAA